MVTNVPTEEITIQATAVSPGIAIGRIYPLRHKFNTDIPLDTPVTEAEVDGELARFHRAQDATRSELQQLKEQLDRKLQNGDAGIFDAHLLIVDDRGMTNAVETMIRSELKNADYAFFRTSERYAAALAATDDKYLQERAADIRDVSNRIRRHLQNQAAETNDLPDQCIIVAPDLTPSETAGLDKNKVLGFAVETGSAVSHTAILARSMRIPAVTGVPRNVIEQLSAADTVIIDGFHGRFILYPEPRTEEAYRLKAAEADKVFSAMRNSAMPSVSKTKDMWPEVVEVEGQYIEPFRTKVDYYVDTCHEYELGVYRGEIERLASEGKLNPEDIPFLHIVNSVDVVPKSMIPDNSLMWEFVDKE